MLGADGLRVVFDRNCSTERKHDRLTLMDGHGSKTYAVLSGVYEVRVGRVDINKMYIVISVIIFIVFFISSYNCFISVIPIGREWSDWNQVINLPGSEMTWKFKSDGSVNGFVFCFVQHKQIYITTWKYFFYNFGSFLSLDGAGNSQCTQWRHLPAT